MGRFLWGVGSALLLVAAGMLFWRGWGGEASALPPAPPAELAEVSEEMAAPLRFATPLRAPAATPKSKEEKRFNRYDKDKNGAISSGEYLVSRQKAFQRLDTNRDGTLQFSEYATKAALKFRKADADRSGILTRTEFASTRVIRKDRRKPDCPTPLRRQFPSAPSAKPATDSGDEPDGDA